MKSLWDHLEKSKMSIMWRNAIKKYHDIKNSEEKYRIENVQREKEL